MRICWLLEGRMIHRQELFNYCTLLSVCEQVRFRQKRKMVKNVAFKLVAKAPTLNNRLDMREKKRVLSKK